MRGSDLYFILNPALGIIKIGIAADAQERRKTLEYGCGVPLEVLRVVPGAGDFEESLHNLFGASRLLGEWFAPTEDLIALATGNTPLAAYVEQNREAIITGRNAREADMARRKADQLEAEKADREEAARIREEEKRLKKEREARQKAAEKKRAATREKEREAVRERVAEQTSAWMSGQLIAFKSIDRSAAVAAAEERRAIYTEQRARNAAMIGLASTEINRNEPQRTVENR